MNPVKLACYGAFIPKCGLVYLKENCIGVNGMYRPGEPEDETQIFYFYYAYCL